MFRPVYSSRNHLHGPTMSWCGSKDEFIVALPSIFIADFKGVFDILNNNRALKTVSKDTSGEGNRNLFLVSVPFLAFDLWPHLWTSQEGNNNNVMLNENSLRMSKIQKTTSLIEE